MRRYRRFSIKLVIVASITCIALFHGGVGAAFFLALLSASVTGLIDRRAGVMIGLLCLFCCFLLLTAAHEAWLQQSTLVNYYIASAGLSNPAAAADQVSLWAYYLLCIGVVAQISHRIVLEKRHDGR